MGLALQIGLSLTAGGGVNALPAVSAGTLAVRLEGDTSHWTTSARSTLANVGDPDGAWDDAAGSSRHVLQATAGNRAALAAGPAGLPAVRFNGTSSSLGNAFAMTQPTTVFLVAKKTGTGNLYLFDGAATNQMAFISQDETHVRMYAGTLFDVAAVPANWNVYTGLFNGASSVLGVNGVETAGDAGTQATTGLTVGASGGGGSLWFTGDILAVLVYTGAALAAPDRLAVARYLGRKYGVGVA